MVVYLFSVRNCDSFLYNIVLCPACKPVHHIESNTATFFFVSISWSTPPQPAFEPILVSSIPNHPIDPTKVIVSLETSTTTHRTTLKTLMSRPSHVATYLKSIIPSKERESDEVSVDSQASEANSSFNSIFHNHLTSSGLLPQGSTSIHIFLDRPSAP